MANAEALNITDAESAYSAISELVINFPGYPSTFKANNSIVRWNMLQTDKASIGLFPLSGAVYIKKYVSGSYVAQLPFEIIYRTTATTNKANIAAQDLITELAKWLEKCAIGFEDKNITLESINRTTPVFVANQNEKHIEFAVNMQLRYSFKK